MYFKQKFYHYFSQFNPTVHITQLRKKLLSLHFSDQYKTFKTSYCRRKNSNCSSSLVAAAAVVVDKNFHFSVHY